MDRWYLALQLPEFESAAVDSEKKRFEKCSERNVSRTYINVILRRMLPTFLHTSSYCSRLLTAGAGHF